MARHASGPIIALSDCADDPRPLYIRLAEHVRGLISGGNLAPGDRLPSTRQLSVDLRCSRNTVVAALDHLIAEGYLESRRGSGTFVARDIPDAVLTTPARGEPEADAHVPARSPRIASNAARYLKRLRVDREKRPAFSRQPDASSFPFDLWSKLFHDVWRHGGDLALNCQDPMGYPPFREAVAEHLAMWRGIACDPSQIMVTLGTTHAMHFLSRFLIEAGDECWVENPGFLEAKNAIRSVGAEPIPVPCDSEGVIVSAGRERAPRAKAAFVTPSHHHPLGMVMSETRRRELLAWAANAEAWIVEDDHDSEIRHAGQPHPTLKASDENDCVIYVGTFSKAMFQSIRLGFIVLPRRLAPVARRYRSATEVCAPISIQPVMERFLREGHFAAHLRRVRKLYLGRKQVFRDLAAAALPAEHVLMDDDVGTHLIMRLNAESVGGVSDADLSRRLWSRGINATPLSDYDLAAEPQGGFVLGYGALDERGMAPALETLAQTLTA